VTQLVVFLRYTFKTYSELHIAFSGVAIRQIELDLRRIHLSYIHLTQRFTYAYNKNDRTLLLEQMNNKRTRIFLVKF